MKRNHLIAISIIILAGLIAYVLYLNNTRYYITTTTRGVGFEVDRRTGKTWVLIGTDKVEQMDKSSTEPSVETIPNADLVELTGTSRLSTNSFFGSIYNGTAWTVKEITFILTVKEKNGSVRWRREYKETVNIAPKTSEDVYFKVTQAEDFDEWTWAILKAKGIR